MILVRYSLAELDDLLPVLEPGEEPRAPDGGALADDAEVNAFLDAHNADEFPGAMVAAVRGIDATVARNGGARHPALRMFLYQALSEAAVGAYPARQAVEQGYAHWKRHVAGERRSPNELRHLLRWQVPKVEARTDLAEVRARLDEVFWEPKRGAESSNGQGHVEGLAAQVEKPAKIPPRSMNLPVEFWGARESLLHIRKAAHARGRSADAVLLAVLARLSARGSPGLALPGIVGSRAALNFFAAIIAASGIGKSTAVSIACDLLPCSDVKGFADHRPIGSGEGVAETFMGEEDDGSGKNVRRQVRHNAFFVVDEGQALIDIMKRKESVLPSELRKAWTGSTLGQANATANRTRIVRDYRLGLVVAFQPTVARTLLADETGGTPQRFMWASAVDPEVPTRQPAWPGQLVVPAPDRAEEEAARRRGDLHRQQDPGVRQVFGVHEDIVAEVKAEDLARVRGVAVLEPLDGHATLTRLKVAALLATLEGRLRIDLEDWALAAQIWAMSCAVRDEVRRAVAVQVAEDYDNALNHHGRLAEVDEIARLRAQRKVERVARRLASFAHTDPSTDHTTRDLGQRLNGVERRDLLDTAVAFALEHEWLTTTAAGNFRAGEQAP